MLTFGKNSSAAKKNTRCSLYWQPDGIGIVAADFPKAGKPIIHLCEYTAIRGVQAQAKILHQYIKKYKLTKAPFVWTLDSHNYQLFSFQIDNLPLDEIKKAAKWKAVDFIDYPIDEAYIDCFPIPSSDPDIIMAYIVVARKELIATRVQTMQYAGINLTSIGITELALRNLAQRFEIEKHSIGLFHLHHSSSLLIICQADLLYLIRHCEMELNEHDITSLQYQERDDRILKDKQSLCTSLAEEIDRSFKFYMTQFLEDPPDQLLYVPSPLFDIEGIKTTLQEKLNIPVVTFNIDHIFESEVEISKELTDRMLPQLGALLYSEDMQ